MKDTEEIKCAKCGKPTTTRLAWFDPYCKGGKQVHYECLSQKRKDEILKERQSV